MYCAVYCWMTKVEKQTVPFLLSSHKQKCFCNVKDIRNDKSVQYIHYNTALQESSRFYDIVGKGVETQVSLPRA